MAEFTNFFCYTVCFSDLVSYDVESDEVEVLCDGTSSQSEFSFF